MGDDLGAELIPQPAQAADVVDVGVSGYYCLQPADVEAEALDIAFDLIKASAGAGVDQDQVAEVNEIYKGIIGIG